MSHRHERTIARRAALQVLYSGEITDVSPTELVECGAYIEEDAPIDDYAVLLIQGVEQHCGELDALLEEVSQNWALSRMPIVDRQILRIAIFEMKYVDEVPVSVSINEAVELAKQFGGEDESHRFANGVLGRIAKYLDGADVDADSFGDADTDAGTGAPGLKIAKDPV